MRPAHPTEQAVGIDHYVSDAEGTGGRLRERPADFRVEEREAFDVEPLDADPGSYPHVVCRVRLENWDTNDFAARISDLLGMSRERVSWAGTKDKRAVTTQLFSLQGVDPDAIPEIGGADVEVIGRAGRPVLFGDLAGNDFRVVVRDPDRPGQADQVGAQLRAFRESGGDPDAVAEAVPDECGELRVAVPNYFGQQRFGSRRPVTHEVGLAIARRDWEGAVLSYVGNPYESEPESTRQARAFVAESRDWSAALDRFPRRLGYERSMLQVLAETEDPGPEQFRQALESLPTNLQSLLVHAAQSYAFNRILGERLRRGIPLGEPVEGDVVCFQDADAPEGFAVPDTGRTQRVTAARVDTVARHCERGRAFVTAPLVGTETELAEGEPGAIEREVLSELALAPGDFDLPGEFASSGDRRATLVETNLTVERDPLAFEFSLPKGSYATVLLREFLKTDPLEMG